MHERPAHVEASLVPGQRPFFLPGGGQRASPFFQYQRETATPLAVLRIVRQEFLEDSNSAGVAFDRLATEADGVIGIADTLEAVGHVALP